MKEDLGIDMQGSIVILKLDGMLYWKKKKDYKVWRLRRGE